MPSSRIVFAPSLLREDASTTGAEAGAPSSTADATSPFFMTSSQPHTAAVLRVRIASVNSPSVSLR